MQFNNYKEVILFDDSKKVIEYVAKQFQKDYHFSVSLVTCLVELRGQEEILRYKKINGKKKLNAAT